MNNVYYLTRETDCDPIIVVESMLFTGASNTEFQCYLAFLFFSQSAKINPFQGWAVNSVAPAVLMHCGSSGGDKMGDLLKTNQLNVTFIDPILSQSAVTDWVLRANAETFR